MSSPKRRAPAALLSALFLAAALPAAPLRAGEWAAADGVREWSFPRDHGAHPEFRTEWWYFTGLLADEAGRRYGYQLTFFRQGVRPEPDDPANPWSVRDVLLAHLAVTEVGARRFGFAERVSRTGPGLAGADAGGLRTWVLDWSAAERDGAIELAAADGGTAVRLLLRPRSRPVLHGSGGLNRKGALPGEASWYASVPDLETTGSITARGAPVAVRGSSWFDHEFGSGQLPAGVAGWDWFGVRLSDGSALMLYVLRSEGGAAAATSGGTLVAPDGSARSLGPGDFTVASLTAWRSPASGARYPARWRVAVPAAGVRLEIAPLVADQELRTPRSTGVTYWEGAVGGSGFSGTTPVGVEGYVELTGYAGPMGGLF